MTNQRQGEKQGRWDVLVTNIKPVNVADDITNNEDMAENTTVTTEPSSSAAAKRVSFSQNTLEAARRGETKPLPTSRSKKILNEGNAKDDDIDDRDAIHFSSLLLAMISGISYYYIVSMAVIIVWSVACTYIVEMMRSDVEQNPGSQYGRWLDWFEDFSINMIGSLFVFSLVFRFNQCYSRWLQGRLVWGAIIQNCLDFSRKTTLWILDKELADRLNRYIVVFPYACKAQLRGLSLLDDEESGSALVDRGFLTDEELQFLSENPCWEPEFVLDMMRAVVAKAIIDQWAREPDEQVLLIPHSNRIHDRLFPPFEKSIYDLSKSIGEGVSVRSAGLPRSYDTVHYIFFWIYFFLAPVAQAATIGWVAPIMLAFLAGIVMTLMDMGTAMVDPFGTDLVDLPIERFCESIEAQVLQIQRRHNSGKVWEFAQHSTPRESFHSSPIGVMKSNLKIDLKH